MKASFTLRPLPLPDNPFDDKLYDGQKAAAAEADPLCCTPCLDLKVDQFEHLEAGHVCCIFTLTLLSPPQLPPP